MIKAAVKLFPSVLISFSLVACGGGGGSDDGNNQSSAVITSSSESSSSSLESSNTSSSISSVNSSSTSSIGSSTSSKAYLYSNNIPYPQHLKAKTFASVTPGEMPDALKDDFQLYASAFARNGMPSFEGVHDTDAASWMQSGVSVKFDELLGTFVMYAHDDKEGTLCGTYAIGEDRNAVINKYENGVLGTVLKPTFPWENEKGEFFYSGDIGSKSFVVKFDPETQAFISATLGNSTVVNQSDVIADTNLNVFFAVAKSEKHSQASMDFMPCDGNSLSVNDVFDIAGLYEAGKISTGNTYYYSINNDGSLTNWHPKIAADQNTNTIITECYNKDYGNNALLHEKTLTREPISNLIYFLSTSDTKIYFHTDDTGIVGFSEDRRTIKPVYSLNSFYVNVTTKKAGFTLEEMKNKSCN